MLYFEKVEDRLMLSSVAAGPLDATDPRLIASPNLSVTIPLQSPLLTRSLGITGFTLVDSTTNQSLGALTEGETIDLATLPKHGLSIVADTFLGHVGSVMFGYDGNNQYHVENYLPYTLVGSADPQYSTWTPTLGSHTVSAVGYSKKWANGYVGKPTTVDFTVINSAAVTNFSLVDADNNQILGPLVDGQTINLATLPTQNLTVVATTNPGTVGSVVFGYDDNPAFHTENFSNYSLAGKTGNGYYAWTPAVGTHTLTATPFSEALGQGSSGTPLSVSFTVTNVAPVLVNVTGFELFNLDTNTTIETLTEGQSIDLATLPTPNVAIVADTDSGPGSIVFGIDGTASFQTADSAPFGLDTWGPTVGPHTVTATAYTSADGQGFAGTSLTLDFSIVDSTPVPTEEVASIIGFTLVDADNGHTLGQLAQGETLDLGTLPTQNLEVVAALDTTSAGSVVFEYDGDAPQIQDSSPYIFGTWTPELGTHTLTAAPYSGPDGTGDFGNGISIGFNVIHTVPVIPPVITAPVTGFSLIDNDTGAFLGSLTEGQTIDLGALPTQNVSIVALTDDTVGPVGSVIFGSDGNLSVQTADSAPYALSSLPAGLGPHTVSATPFSGADGTGTAGTSLSVDFNVVNSSAVTGLTLIDTYNNQPVQAITNGGTIDLAGLPSQNLAIAATTTNSAVGSVLFTYDGNANTPLEATQIIPSGAWLPSIGQHTLIATPYSGQNGLGIAGNPLTVNFRVIDSDATSGFTLINSDTGQAIEKLTEGAAIDLNVLAGQNLSIVANTRPSTVGSVVFGYDGNSDFDTEDTAPYILGSWSPVTGTHTITATPYSAPDGGGFAGTPLTVDFTVVNSTAVTGFTLVNADTGQSLGALTEGETLDLHTLPTTDLTVIANTAPTTVGSVVFGYDSTANYQLDNSAPYSLTGGVGVWTPTVGPHTITATSYAAANAGGLVGISDSVDFNVIDSTPVNPPPTNDPNISVSITNPINGESQAGPGYFVIRTSTADSDGPLSKVDFYVNGNLLGEANAQPYSMAWENAAPGTYTLTAVASDANGSSVSAPVSVTITTPVVARTIYVSPSGSDSNTGLSLGGALQTITAAANMAKPGDTVLIEPGTYRETVTVPTGGTETNPITFAAAVPGTVIIDGADPLGGWTPAASTNPIFTTGWNHDFFHGSTRYYFGLSTDGTTTAVGYAEQFLYNGKPLTQVLSASTMTIGTFFIDYTARTVSVWLPGGATPTSSNMLASTRSHLFLPASTSVQYVRIDGLIFQHAANFSQDEAVQTATGWRVLNSTIQVVNAGGLDVKGNNNLVYNVHAMNNGDTGIDGTGSNNLFVFDETGGNNTKGFSTFNEAGGGKFAKSDGAYFDQYYAHDNVGPGLWFDFQNTNYVVTNSYFYNNKPRVQNYEGIGLQIEISAGPGRVQNNTFYGNTGAALDICESMNVTAENNYFHNSYLELRDLPNRDPYHIQNINIADNEFDNSFISTSSGTWTTTSGLTKQIFINDDTFSDTGPLVYWNGVAYRTLSTVFNTLGFEQNGVLGALTFTPAPSVV